MGNLIKRKITMFRFAKETFKCPFNKEQMNIHDFEAEVNGLIKETNIRIGALLCKAIFTPNPMIAYPSVKESKANKLVFYNLFDEEEKYILVDQEIVPLSDEFSLDVDMLNKERKEAFAKVEEFYTRAYELLGTARYNILTEYLDFSYSLGNDFHYALSDKFGNISEIREIDSEYDRLPDTDNKFYINRGFAIATVDYQLIDEIRRIKKELDELWEILSPRSQDNDNEEAVGSTHDVKTMNLR